MPLTATPGSALELRALAQVLAYRLYSFPSLPVRAYLIRLTWTITSLALAVYYFKSHWLPKEDAPLRAQ